MNSPRWTSEERDLWIEFFSAYSQSLMPGEETRAADVEDKAERAVKLAAKLADSALLEFQFRLYSQGSGGLPVESATEMNATEQFAEFSEWLNTRGIRKRVVKKGRTKTR